MCEELATAVTVIYVQQWGEVKFSFKHTLILALAMPFPRLIVFLYLTTSLQFLFIL